MKNSVGFRKFGLDVVATLVRQVGSGLIQLVIVIAIARLYGPEGNGAYTVAMLLPLTLASLMNMGVGPANVYFLSAGLLRPKHAWKKVLKLYLALSILGLVVGCFVILLSGARLFSGVDVTLLWLALVAFPISLFLAFVSSFFQGLQQFRIFNLVLLLQPIVALTFIFSFFVFDLEGICFVILAYILSTLITSLVAVVKLRPLLRTEDAKGIEKECPSFVSYGMKAHLSNIITFLNYKADLFLVNVFIGPVGAGVYAIAMQLSEKLWLFSGAVSTVLLPKLSELSSNETEKSALTPVICRWVLMITALGCLALIFAADLLVRLLFGQEFMSAVPPLLALMPGIVLWAGGRVLGNDIASRGKPETNLYISIFVFLVNVGGNLILIPAYGLIGAAIATSVAYGLDFFLKLSFYLKVTSNNFSNVVFVTRSDLSKLKSVLMRVGGRV